MALEEDLRAIGDRAHRELDALLDFFDHSKVLWQSLQEFVDAGHTVALNSLKTGTAIDQTGLLALAPDYKQRAASFVFRQFVATLEEFLFEVLHRLLLHNPWQFAAKQLTFDVVLNAASREEIISGVVRKQLNELKYEHLREWFAALNKTVKLGCPSADEVEALAEVKATRDLLEHNAGVANDIYLRKAGNKARLSVGELVEIDETYLIDSWHLLKKVAADVSAAAIAKVAKP